MSFQERFFERAFELAEQGRGRTSPNPFVGAVIVKDNLIVGEGFTQPAGGNHAEIQAIQNAGNKCKDASLYVTLEPCSHYGKTPPCVDAIIKSGIKRVYAGIEDPNPLVSGKGFEILKANNIEVISGIWEKQIKKQLESFIVYITQKRPFFSMKNAYTLDGKIATDSGDSFWITGEESRNYVHRLRTEADAIITGIGTVLADDPMLNVRISEFIKNPVRIILDSKLSIPVESNIVKSASEIKTFVIYSSNDASISKLEQLKTLNVNVIKCLNKENTLDLTSVKNWLYLNNFMNVFVEAGRKLSTAFIKENLVDKIYSFIAPKIVGGNFSYISDLKIDKMKNAVNLDFDEIKKIGNDVLIISYLKS